MLEAGFVVTCNVYGTQLPWVHARSPSNRPCAYTSPHCRLPQARWTIHPPTKLLETMRTAGHDVGLLSSLLYSSRRIAEDMTW